MSSPVLSESRITVEVEEVSTGLAEPWSNN